MELYLTNRKRLALPDDMDLSPEDMPIETVLRGLDVAAQSRPNAPVVILKGNEPMLYPDLEQVFASCRKRNLSVIVETCGLMPTLARKILCEQKPIVMLKLYRPEVLSQEMVHEREETIGMLVKAGVEPKLLVMVDDVKASYDFSLEYARAHGVSEILYRVSCRRSPEDLCSFVSWFMAHLIESLRTGLTLMLDCGVRYCSFTDAEYGVFSKVNCKFGECVPHPGVLPNGNVIHCKEMYDLPGRPVSTFKSMSELTGYYYEVFNDLQWQVRRFEQCQECMCRLNNCCLGMSMAAKADKVKIDYKTLRDTFVQDNDGQALAPEKREEGLWHLGHTAFMLCKYVDAIECFEELRGLHPEQEAPHVMLGFAYWECGRLTESEEEFRKGARLSKEPVPILSELHKRLVRNGNNIKARLLQGEIEKLAAAAKG